MHVSFDPSPFSPIHRTPCKLLLSPHQQWTFWHMQKAVHPSIHRPLKVVVQPFLISTDLLYPGERMSCSVCTCAYCGAVWSSWHSVKNVYIYGMWTTELEAVCWSWVAFTGGPLA